MAKNKKPKSKKKNVEAEAEASAPAKKPSVGPLEFARQVRNEGSKVTWTSRNEMMISTVMVMIMVVIMSVFFLLVDQFFRFAVPGLLNLFG